MRRPGGYACITEPSGRVLLDHFQCVESNSNVVEFDTFTCSHCNRVIHVMPRAKPEDLGGLCKVCMKLVCPSCVGHGCDPMEEKLKRAEDRERTLRSYGL